MLRENVSMVGLSQGSQLEVTIHRISNNGNALTFIDGGESHINIGKVDQSVGDTVQITISGVSGDNYFARLASSKYESFKASKSASVGKTRSMGSSEATVHERHFDPRTHGAPEIDRPEPKTWEVEEDEDGPELYDTERKSPDMGSLAEIAQTCDEPFTEAREERARESGRKEEWKLKPPLDASKKP